MPVEYCRCCKRPRSMHMAASRIHVLLKSGGTAVITTHTYSCRSCRSLVLPVPGNAKADAKKAALPKRSRTTGLAVASAPVPSRLFGRAVLPLALLAFFLLGACETVPVTHRHQLDLVPASTILPMSFNSYKDFLSKHKVIDNTPEAAMVKQVGTRIQQAVERYMAQQNLSDRLKGYAWEFHLVEDNQANAFCMPGGKVVVYSGILPITKDDNGLAVVLGHEIAHAVANHGDERMSQGLLAQMGGIALSAALSQKPAETQNLFMTAYGAGAEVGVLLPYSRLQESEADHLGLIFMAMAGYDPRNAVAFWQRMMQSQQGGRPPALLSDHPADEKRIKDVEKLIPEAMKYYKA